MEVGNYMKRIVMFEGGVETLAYFAHQMAAQFERMGYLVFFYDLRDEERSAKRLRKFIRPRETVLVTFNFQGLEKEAGVYRAGIGYIWDDYGIPCYNIAADHPYFYDDRLRELPKDYHHISIDRRQQAYFKEFYPEYLEAGFLPLAGTELAVAAMSSGGAEAAIAAAACGGAELAAAVPSGKRYDVILTGNYTKLSFFEPYINWINDEYAAFYRGIIDDLLAYPAQTVEEVALAHCEREMGKEPNDELRIALHKMIFIDLYVRNYWRGLAVRTLVNAGITVHVVGKGWEELEDVSSPGNLIVHPQTDSLTCLRMLSESKVSLNVMPWFKDGAHDRIFTAMLQETVALTDDSRYLCEEFTDGEDIVFFSLEEREHLPELVHMLLEDETKAVKIAENGWQKASRRHTWSGRARELALAFK